MFDLVGYWGFLTLSLMSPVVLVALAFILLSGKRIKELGGNEVKVPKILGDIVDKILSPLPVVAMVIGIIISVLVSCYWLVNSSVFTFIGAHSYVAEFFAPFWGWVVVVVGSLVAWDMLLKMYVKVAKVISKVEAKLGE